jgi:hypothetical protein
MVVLVAITVFDAVIVVILTFAARIQPEPDGVTVEQFGISHLRYPDLLKCVTVPFSPTTFVFVKTNRSLPLKILFCPPQLDISSGGKVERWI